MNNAFIPLVPETAMVPASPADSFVPVAVATASDPAHAPKLTLKRDGDRVTHITVRCTCGQSIELACEY
jgi:hypothetical protein